MILQTRLPGVNGITGIWLRNFSRSVFGKGQMFSPYTF